MLKQQLCDLIVQERYNDAHQLCRRLGCAQTYDWLCQVEFYDLLQQQMVIIAQMTRQALIQERFEQALDWLGCYALEHDLEQCAGMLIEQTRMGAGIEGIERQILTLRRWLCFAKQIGATLCISSIALAHDVLCQSYPFSCLLT